MAVLSTFEWKQEAINTGRCDEVKGQHLREPVTQRLSPDEEVKRVAESESVSSSEVIASPPTPSHPTRFMWNRPDNTAKNESFPVIFQEETPNAPSLHFVTLCIYVGE